MNRRYPTQELFAVRNHIPIRLLIESILHIPAKIVEGIFRFLCPLCSEFQTATQAKTNLARCFRCQKNFNTIDLVMIDKGLNFVQSVKFLKKHLVSFSQRPGYSQISRTSPCSSDPLVPIDDCPRNTVPFPPIPYSTETLPAIQDQPQPPTTKSQAYSIPCPSVRNPCKKPVPIGEIIRQPDFLPTYSPKPAPSHPGHPSAYCANPPPILSPDHPAQRISQLEQNVNSLAQLLQRIEAALDAQR